MDSEQQEKPTAEAANAEATEVKAETPAAENTSSVTLTTTTQENTEPSSEKKQPEQQQPLQQNNMGIPVRYNHSRNASPVTTMMRPASAMSVNSTASYLTAGTASTAITTNSHHPSSNNNAAMRYNSNHNAMYGRGQQPQPQQQYPPHHYLQQQQHPHAQGMVRPVGRYPAMPPRGGMGYPQQQQRYPTQQYHHQGGPPRYHHQEYAQHQQQMPYHHAPQEGYIQEQSAIPPPPPPQSAEKPENSEVQEQQGNDAGSTAAISNQDGGKEEQPAMEEGGSTPTEKQENVATAENTAPVAQDQEKMQQQGPATVAPQMNNANMQMQQQQQHYVGGYGEQQHHQQYYQQQQAYQQQYHGHHAGYSYGHHHQQHGIRYGQQQGYHYGNEGAGGISPPPHYQHQQQHYQQHQQYHHNDYAAHHGHHGHHQGHYGMHSQQEQQQHYARHGMPPAHPHHHQGGFQLPQYNATSNANSRRGSFEASPETTVDAPMLSRSPSPPPQPPANGANKQASGDASMAGTDSVSSSKAKALGERGQNTKGDAESAASSTAKDQPVKKEDATADAASILLALGMQSKGGENENLPGTVQGSRSMDDASEMTHPDLTSEPSNDSMEQSQAASTTSRVPDSEFPCPIPAKYPTRLCLPYDGAKLNSLHCFLRSELLEIFVVKKSANKSTTHSPHSSVGRVGLRCVHCAMIKRNRDDRDEAPMAVFYPKSVAEIYRLVTSWQRCHLRKCRNLPPAVRAKWQELRDTDKSRGKTHYWVTSAKEIGLRDCHSRAGGIKFVADLDASTLPPQTRIVENDAPQMESAVAPVAAPKSQMSGDPPGAMA